MHNWQCYRELQKTNEELRAKVDELEDDLADVQRERDEAIRAMRSLRKAKKEKALIADETDIAGWGPGDIVSYFEARYHRAYKKHLKLDVRKRRVACRDVSQFQSRHEWSNARYKAFIDESFNNLYNREFKPGIKHLTSDAVLDLLGDDRFERTSPKRRVRVKNEARPTAVIDWRSRAREESARVGVG